MNEDDELLDLVNRADEVIGTINRKEYNRLLESDAGYLRAAQFFLVNSEGQVYVPVRTAHKTIAPSGYDYSAGGHVGAGDDYLSALVREAKEELDLDVSPEDLELIAKVVEDEIRYINCIYALRSDANPTLNPDDFVSAEWLTPAELIARIDAGHPAKDSLRGATLRLQEYLQ